MEPAATKATLLRLLAADTSTGHSGMLNDALPDAPCDSALMRGRLEVPEIDAEVSSLSSQRSQGIALCSRQARERKLFEQLIVADTCARLQPEAEMANRLVVPQGGKSTVAAGEAAPSGKRKRDESKRKAAPALPRVEVDLRSEGLASWYEATVIQETKSRSKVRLLQLEEDDELHIEGRPHEEWVSSEFSRPLPPRSSEWQPTVGEHCELSFLNGWWPVRVKRPVGADKWHVIYEVMGNAHTVPTERLRQILVWDPISKSFHQTGK